MGRRSITELNRLAARLASGPLGALVLVCAVAGIRMALTSVFPRIAPFSLYYPAILVAALFGGLGCGFLALLASLLLGLFGQIGTPAPRIDPPSEIANLVIHVLVGGAFALVGARLRGLFERRAADNAALAERELRYRTLFEGVSDGFALLQGVWAPEGRLADVRVLESNPALLRMFGERASGARGNGAGGNADTLHRDPAGYLAAAEQAFQGEIVELSFEGPRGGRWYELRLYPVGENQVAEIVVDITAHKLAERRQDELFEELNHRVKNNLALVSAILGMQARLTDDEAMAEHLRNAVARIQAIADVHASLYRTGRKDDVDFASYLHHLCDRLSNSLVDREHVRIELSADPATVPLDDAVALGLVVNELVTNAAKYAYPGTSGVVQVILRNTPEGLQLTVRDEGRGLSSDHPRSGLGMRLVRSLVQQCGGVLRTGTGPGASFTVDLRARGSTAPAEAAQTPLL